MVRVAGISTTTVAGDDNDDDDGSVLCEEDVGTTLGDDDVDAI